MKRLAMLAGAALALTVLAAPAHSAPNRAPIQRDCSADHFRTVARIAYQPWYRPVTNRHRLHQLKACAPNTRTRAGMNRIHRNVARGRAHAVGRYHALTPYPGCGELDRSAIPTRIVERESGCQWNIWNTSGSGAAGPYQLLGHGAPMPVDDIHDRMAHHKIAHELWLECGETSCGWGASA